MTQKKELQVAIGYLLYYGRCVDGRVLPATCALASAQTQATLATMAALERLLGFVSAHHDGRCERYRKRELFYALKT